MKMIKLTAGIMLCFLNVLLFYSFPYAFFYRKVGADHFALISIGFCVYVVLHIVKRPENFYIWNHEFSHLLASKWFFKPVRGFHISRKKGGRVIVDETNFVIDLAPYFFFPLIIITTLFSILLKRAGFPSAVPIYFISFGFLFGMMLSFNLSSFVKKQEDIMRNGIIFSASLILCINFMLLPAYMLPGIAGKRVFMKDVTLLWTKNVSVNTVTISTALRSYCKEARAYLSK